MRALAAAILIGLALVAATPAGGDEDVRGVALENAKNDLTTAKKAEYLAYHAFKAGRVAEGIRDIKASEASVAEANGPVHYLEVPPAFGEIFPKDPWKNIVENWDNIRFFDEKAMGPNVAIAKRVQYLLAASEKKNDLIDLVTAELAHPPCVQVTDVRGPIVVNGVPQGKATLSVEVSCTKPVDEVDLVLPGLTIDQMQADNGDKAMLQGAILKVIGDGTSKQVGVTIQTSPDPAKGDQIDEVIEIKGDSYDAFDETM
jgi:hypothetical protein